MINICSTDPNAKALIVYCSVVPYSYPPFHRIEFVRQLSKSFNVIFINLPTDASYFKQGEQVLEFYLSLLRNLVYFNKSFVWEFFNFRKINLHILFFYLLFQKFILKKKIVLYTTSGYTDIVYKYIPHDKSIFDCPDVHENEFEANKRWIKSFDLVFVNTKPVFEVLKGYTNKVVIVPAGYRNLEVVKLPQNKIPNSVIFTGGISQRLDYGLLTNLIQNTPNIDFYFAGQIYLNKYYAEPEDKTRLIKWKKILAFPNTYYLGDLSEDLQAYILPIFKVGIIPYLTDDIFNHYSNPIKLYDYLASGMSVVSTALPNVSVFRDTLPVYIANSPLGFSKRIAILLKVQKKEKTANEKALRSLFEKESMQAKVNKVLGLFKDYGEVCR